MKSAPKKTRTRPASAPKHQTKRAKKRNAIRRHRNQRNPEETAAAAEAAAAMFEEFHGRAPRRILEYVTEENDIVDLAQLGRLVELQVLLDDDWAIPLEGQGNIEVCTTPNGGQIYFVGGKQNLDLESLGLADQLPKDQVVIGDCASITYHTVKDFHDFEPTDYEHQFGDEGGSLPVLNYDTTKKLMFLTGGTYQVKPEGIVN